ncbi:hypothetical protein RHSIM_Rhsim05G0012300 [Rhododendron simsii]|uniref:Replication protein A subunit n=1 Tax=Rhododendron simsii TaxID=118357 RepID=A0A834LPA6_RHOSS|nr:hypothetical protein RHSIM_Rhsim05G0012300 [Rhododendron simsii]
MIGDRQCNRKVTRSGNSRWQCDWCNQEIKECDYRYLLQAQVHDNTGLTWVTAFQESGEEILGCPAKDLYFLKYEEEEDVKLAEIIRGSLFAEYLFRLKIQEELYGDEQRVKITVVKAEKVNYSAESIHMLDLIAKNVDYTGCFTYMTKRSGKAKGTAITNRIMEIQDRIIPISALNPYQHRWAIKARVTAKGDIRRYPNAHGDGKVFSFDLLDSDGGEIRATCFNAVLDRFYEIIEVGKVYFISKGSLKPAQKNFNHLKNEWEIILQATSAVDLCPDEDGSIPSQQFSFRPISEIEIAENNSIIDTIGIVTAVNPSVSIMRKNGMETQRRILNLKDQSGRSVELTLWGDFCNREGQNLQEMVDSGFSPVLAVKAGKVNDFSGKSIGTISATQLFINLDSSEAQSLRIWFDQGGKNTTSQSISRDIIPGGPKNEIRKTVSQIKDEGLGRLDKPDWITVKAIISSIKTDTFCYTACPLMIGDRQCNRKVTRSGNSRWQCDWCNQEIKECDYRYLLQAQVQDNTGLTWVTVFQESGEEILGCPAKDLYFLKYEEEDDVKFAEIIRGSLFAEYLFKLKIKEELYGDEQRVKITVVKAEKVNYSAECKRMLDLIAKVHYR